VSTIGTTYLVDKMATTMKRADMSGKVAMMATVNMKTNPAHKAQSPLVKGICKF